MKDILLNSAEAQTETQSQSSENVLSDARVPGLTLLYHPELQRIGERAMLTRLSPGGTLPLSRLEPGFAAPGSAVRTPLGAACLSRQPLLLAAGSTPGAIRLSCSTSRTRVLVAGQEVSSEREFSADELERGVVLLLGGQVVLLLHRVDPFFPTDLPTYGLVGDSPAMLRVRREIRQVADLEVPVLLRGETGTGKELVAQAIHRASPRRVGPWLAVNLSAVPATLAAAEFFGAAKGAFTGADGQREGYFVRAQGGSLFLDEVGAAPPELQVLLLRALESGEIQPLGAPRSRQVDVRVISATDADLDAAVSRGAFSAPLLYRLGGFVLRLPSLAERREDFGRLVLHFLGQELRALGEGHRLASAPRPWLPGSLIARLADYDWPGNVRQLRNVVRQLVIAYRGSEQVPATAPLEHLLATVNVPETKPEPLPHPRPALRRTHELSDAEVLAALRAHRFRLHAAAQQLGIPRSSLYRLIDRNPHIRKAVELGPAEITACLSRCQGSTEAAAAMLEVSPVGLRRRIKQLGL